MDILHHGSMGVGVAGKEGDVGDCEGLGLLPGCGLVFVWRVSEEMVRDLRVRKSGTPAGRSNVHQRRRRIPSPSYPSARWGMRWGRARACPSNARTWLRPHRSSAWRRGSAIRLVNFFPIFVFFLYESMFGRIVLTPRSQEAIQCFFTETTPRTSRTCLLMATKGKVGMVGAEGIFNERCRFVGG